jgi:predicted extracellular nuclease
MMDMDHPKDGRAFTRDKRILQCNTVKKIIGHEFGEKIDKYNFIVLGDFNDYIDSGLEKESGIPSLVQWDKIYNVIQELPEEEQWTHFYNKGKKGEQYKQLDYILLSKALKKKVKKVGTERRGLPLRADRVAEERFEGVDKDKIKASDHCPLYVDLEI